VDRGIEEGFHVVRFFRDISGNAENAVCSHPGTGMNSAEPALKGLEMLDRMDVVYAGIGAEALRRELMIGAQGMIQNDWTGKGVQNGQHLCTETVPEIEKQKCVGRVILNVPCERGDARIRVDGIRVQRQFQVQSLCHVFEDLQELLLLFFGPILVSRPGKPVMDRPSVLQFPAFHHLGGRIEKRATHTGRFPRSVQGSQCGARRVLGESRPGAQHGKKCARS